MKLNDIEYSKGIFKKIIFRMLIYSIAFTAIFIFAVLLGIKITEAYIWQPDDPLYNFLIFIRGNIPFIWASGIILLLFFYLKKSLKYIDFIIKASDDLINNKEELIQLPSDLSIIENRLNQSKQIALKNAMLAKVNEERKNELIVYLAHDLKTPLTSIIGYLELLNESPDLPMSSRAKFSKITLDKAYRLEELINEFFEIARFNVGKVVINKSNLNLKLMFEQIVDEFYPVSKNQNKNIIINCDSSLYIVADPDKISRVFNNVIKNAISYSFENTNITINAFEDKNRISVIIKNLGKTIPKEKLDYIFEKFYRLDDARNTNSGGAGLGLAIAKEIVDAHNGEIYANSKDNVTSFTIILPKN